MDKLIEDYKKELIEDEACGYGYPTGLKNRIIKEVESNKFAIPADKVQEMIESVRGQDDDTGEEQLTIPVVSQQRELLAAFLQYLDENNKAAWITHDGIIGQFLAANCG